MHFLEFILKEVPGFLAFALLTPLYILDEDLCSEPDAPKILRRINYEMHSS